jgi:sec-independent protein translocase protein TatC
VQLVDKAKGIFTLPPADEDEEESSEELQLTIVEHLEELRTRLVRSAMALGIATVVSFLFTPQVLRILLIPAPEGFRLIYIEMTEMFFNYFKVALFTGATLAMPILVYQFVRFIAPGLTRREKRLLLLMLPPVALLFFTGVAFGFFVTLPFAVNYLVTFGSEFAAAQIRIANYISFVTTFLFAMGFGFQMPVVVFTLVKLNIVSTKKLRSYRKYAILVIFVIAAVITPTPDPLNQSLVAIPLFLLYELGILIASIFGENKSE